MAEECEEEIESETPALTLRQLTGLARSLEYPELIQLIVALVGELQARVVLQAAAEAERQEELNRTPWRRARRRAEAKGSRERPQGQRAPLLRLRLGPPVLPGELAMDLLVAGWTDTVLGCLVEEEPDAERILLALHPTMRKEELKRTTRLLWEYSR